MVSCLILYHSTITSLTKCKILRAMFHEEEFEINVIGENTVIIFLWNLDKEKVWQAVVNFETTNMKIGYGFGDRKNDAIKEAEAVLEEWIFTEKAGESLST
ncbi:hypothetical protein KFZ58_05220 [Virgibacillus sp. NKC19-16]|uniref:hypothetical protein n=1 Tax=Virgibacillus salidurans TaxID=2831673 RepID=UPI001F20D2FE|nr:hypothetical protein [Virgibacillus sp. NKC19-16]UJL47311.1 hypothetical protein KFZ58_05220 [Virgibacillus sp. NKC19-16]